MKCPRGLCIFSFLLFLLHIPSGILASQNAPEPSPKKWTLLFEEGRLSANIRNVSLSEVLTELAGQTNLPIDVDGSIADEKVSAVFDPLPLEDGLNALLRHKSYILIYSESEGKPASNADATFNVEGIQIAGKGKGVQGVPGERYRIVPPSPPSPRERQNERRMDEDAATRDPHRGISPGVPFMSPRSKMPNMYDRQSPDEPAVRPPYQAVNPIRPQQEGGTPSAPQQEIQAHQKRPAQTVPNAVVPPPARERTIDELMDQIDELEDRGVAALPQLQEIVRSNPHSEVREHAQDAIDSIITDEDIEEDND